tara:strand:- start:1615 stop:1782 length:168 start_codon:yes stop_codon:yes gene_type:complete
MSKFYIITFVLAFAFILGTQVLREHEHSYKIKYENKDSRTVEEKWTEAINEKRNK